MPSLPDATAEREHVVAAALGYVREGGFFAEMEPRIAIASESARPDPLEDNLRYLDGEMRPLLEGMGFHCQLIANPVDARLPALFAERIENPRRPTILIYGHGDVLWGMAGDWKEPRAERGFRRNHRHADPLDPTLLSSLFAACA
jgi:hypothetical protein